MFCVKCGRETRKLQGQSCWQGVCAVDSAFCSYCGQKVNAPVETGNYPEGYLWGVLMDWDVGWESVSTSREL